MKKHLLFIVVALSLALLASGCWNRRELNTLAIVEAAGFDLDPVTRQVTMTVQILKPAEVKAPAAGGMGSPKGVWVTRSSGRTVFEAVRNFTFVADRKLYFPFCRVLVIGEEMAENGLAPFIDWFERDHEPRLETLVVIARGPAARVLQAEHEQEKIPAAAIDNLLHAGRATSMVPVVTLKDLLARLESKSSQPYLPIIEVFPEKKQDEGEGGKDKGGGPGREVLRLKTGGAAVFKKDKLVGWLDNTETRGLLWVLGKVKSGILVVPAPGSSGNDISLEIIRASREIKPEIKGGKPSITVEIKEEGNLGEQMVAGDLARPEQFQLLEAAQAQAIEGEIRAALQKAQAWGVDIFQFGEAVHRRYRREWKTLEKNWDRVFPNLEVNVKVKAGLRRTYINTRRVMSEQD